MFTLFNRIRNNAITHPLNNSAVRAVANSGKEVVVEIKIDGELVLATATKEKQLTGCYVAEKYAKHFNTLSLLKSALNYKNYKRW